MLSQNRELIADELSEGTGASISVAAVQIARRQGLEAWFHEHDRKHGPVVEIAPHGLKSHVVTLKFGQFAGGLVHQMSAAPEEDLALARALVRSITSSAEVQIEGQHLDDWEVVDGSFKIIVQLRHQGSADAEQSIVTTCREVVVPLMAAMAELIGYDLIFPDEAELSAEMEGGVSLLTVKKRERNPRNRLLCLRLHGYRCKVCGLEPHGVYGDAGRILHVHHLHPLAELDEERSYDPVKDLVPLCPNCHAAVHTQKPWPIPPEELQQTMALIHG
jgi:5-methylcytosine-specific restriction protein A